MCVAYAIAKFLVCSHAVERNANVGLDVESILTSNENVLYGRFIVK